MVHLTDFMDLSNPSVQYFSLPKPLINYAFCNSNILLSQKLMKCCKTFKLLHLKNGKSQMKKFSIRFFTQNIFDLGSCLVTEGDETWPNQPGEIFFDPEIYVDVRCIKVLDDLILEWVKPQKFLQLLPKFDLSLTKTIFVKTNIILKQESLEILFGPSLIDIYLRMPSCENGNPALAAFQKCQKMKKLLIWLYKMDNLMPANILRKMIQCKNNTKLRQCWFSFVEEINPEDLIKFVDKYLEPLGSLGYLSLCYKSKESDNYRNVNQYFANVEQIRSKNECPKVKVHIGQQFELENEYSI